VACFDKNASFINFKNESCFFFMCKEFLSCDLTSNKRRCNSVGSNKDYKSINTINISNHDPTPNINVLINNIREVSYIVHTIFWIKIIPTSRNIVTDNSKPNMTKKNYIPHLNWGWELTTKNIQNMIFP
jgi:hypothetical protein